MTQDEQDALYLLGDCADCVDGRCTMNCSSAVLSSQSEHIAASMWAKTFPAKATAEQVREYQAAHKPSEFDVEVLREPLMAALRKVDDTSNSFDSIANEALEAFARIVEQSNV